MALAPPVSRGNFHYDGQLYVEVGSLNRHKRATVEEITAILRPDLKKPKKGTIDPPKDQVGHWYEAQLIHYGLPPSKDKPRAKMRLLEALNQSRIVVPPNIASMEAEMKKEYATAERKAKAQYKASRATAEKSQPSTAGKKRKQSEDSGNINNINVNISLGNSFPGPSAGANATGSQPSAKKVKTGSSKPAQNKTEKSVSSKPSKSSTDPGTIKKQSKANGKSETKGEAQVKKEVGAGKKTTVKKEAKVKQEPRAKPSSRIKHEQDADSSRTPKQKEARVKQESRAKPSPRIKHEPDADPSRTPKPPSLGLINGIYDLSCPTVENEWGAIDLSLTLALEGTTVWGAYDLGMFSGIIFLPDRPWHASNNDPLPFTFRGRENGEGEMSFGPGCEGEISFLGKGGIEGWIGVYGRCAFQGSKRPGAGMSARDMRAEWEGYNELAYEEEGRSRWM